MREPERIQTIIIGAGQAGLSVGYHLRTLGVPFLILDANEQVGDSWRSRWDSLRLFTPARFDSLDGMPFPAHPDAFPTKDEMANYLGEYARRFELPVRSGVRVDRLTRVGNRYLLNCADRQFEAEHVVVAMANYQEPRVPECSRELKPSIVQMHSSRYRSPAQLQPGNVLIVGAGNSGAEIAIDVRRAGHEVFMAGRDTGHVPFRLGSFAGRHGFTRFVLRFVFHRVLTMSTPFGRRVRPTILKQGGPLIRVKPWDLAAANVERGPKVQTVRDGLPVLEDGRVLDVANVIWCTGFKPGSTWIDLPIFAADGEPRQTRGSVTGEPGLYFVGRQFLYAMSSPMIHGVGRDAAFVAKTIALRASEARSAGVIERTSARRSGLKPQASASS